MRSAPLLTVLAAAGTLTFPGPASAVTAAHRVRLQGALESMTATPAGSVRVAVTQVTHARRRTVVSTVGPRGALGVPSLLWSSPLQVYHPSSVTLTAREAVAAYEHRSRRGRTTIRAVGLAPGGRASQPQRLSNPAASAHEPVAMSGGGAVAVTFMQRKPHELERLTWAYRPAHATRFLPPRVLGQPGTRDDLRYEVAMGPHGEGAVLEMSVFSDDDPPPFRLRRLGADGSVGPWITVSDEGYEDGSGALSIAPDGTIAIAFSASRTVAGRGEIGLVATTLPPGSSSVTPVQHLLTVHGPEPGTGDVAGMPDFGLEVVIGPGDQAVLATAPEDSDRLLLFTGRADALALTGTFVAPGIQIGDAVALTRDGGVTAVWAPITGESAQTIVATHRPPRGYFSQPRIVARTQIGGIADLEPIALLPIHASDALLAYDDSDPDRFTDHLVTLSP